MPVIRKKETNKPGLQQVRLAIVGLGLVGCRHASAIQQVANATLCAVVDPYDNGRQEAAAIGVPCFDDFQAMIKAEKPDGIILATPTKLHAEQGVHCVSANIPVLVEKPLADNLQEARSLVEQAEANESILMVGHHRRFNPLIQKAHTLINEGAIGDVRTVHATCWFYKPDSYFDVAPWRKQLGAGPISVNLVHDIDLMRHLCGEITQVQAQATASKRGYDNEDLAAAILNFENGGLGTITVSDSVVSPWSWEFTSKEYSGYPFTAEGAYQIGGSHGSLSIPDLKLWTHDKDRDWWSPMSATDVSSDIADPLVYQIEHFVEVIVTKMAPLVSGREGLRTLAVVDAIQVAAKTGKTIQLTKIDGNQTLGKYDLTSGNKEPFKPTTTNLAR